MIIKNIYQNLVRCNKMYPKNIFYEDKNIKWTYNDFFDMTQEMRQFFFHIYDLNYRNDNNVTLLIDYQKFLLTPNFLFVVYSLFSLNFPIVLSNINNTKSTINNINPTMCILCDNNNKTNFVNNKPTYVFNMFDDMYISDKLKYDIEPDYKLNNTAIYAQNNPISHKMLIYDTLYNSLSSNDKIYKIIRDANKKIYKGQII